MDWLYTALGSLLHWLSSLFGGSYAFGLLLYALLFKIVFLPFSIKQQKNQIKMAKLTPKIELIKAKYKGRTDQATMRKQQEEIMQLQQQEGYSLMSGCLPMLIQFPLIIFLYKVIRNPLSYICKLSDDAIKQITDTLDALQVSYKSGDQIDIISKMIEQNIDVMKYGAERALPNFDFFGQNLALTPSLAAISILCLIPLFAAGLQWLTMYLTRKLNGNAGQLGGQDSQTAMSMKMMDFTMPALTLWMTFSFSAMMGLYWIYQSVIAIIQILILSKVMPMPKFTEEEIKAMRKAQKEAEKMQKAALKTQPKYRSLHYIDDDDYEELPEIKTNQENTGKTTKLGDAPEIKD